MENELTVNLVVSDMESEGATSRRVMYRTPGVSEISAYGLGSGRAHYALNGREFAVIGSQFVEISEGGTFTAHGAVAVDTRPACIVGNGDAGGQLLITSGGSAYSFVLASNTLAIIAGSWSTATMCDVLDGYGLILDADDSRLWVSDLLDFTTWGAAQFAERSLAPDRWVSMKVLDRYVWLLGESTSEVWYNAGASSSFPFKPYLAIGLLAHGCAAPFSPAVVGESLCWLEQTKSGGTKVVASAGGRPESISTTAMDETMSTYSVQSDAVGDSYTDKGHSFYLLSFQAQDITWSYDFASQTWVQRATWIPEENRFIAWRPRFHAYVFGQHRMLDRNGPSVYAFDYSQTATDVDGRKIRWLRRTPILVLENKRVFYSYLELDLAVGTTQNAVVGDNLIANPGFEVSATGWTLVTSGLTSLARTTTAAYVYAGVGALLATSSQGDYAQAVQSVTVLPGKIYHYEIAMRGGNTSGLAVGDVYLQIQSLQTLNYLTEDGQWESGAGDTYCASMDINDDEYVVFTGDFETEAQTTSLGFKWGTPDTGEAYVACMDAAVLLQITGNQTPRVMMRYSNDGGRNWSSELWREVGDTGEYGKRVRWNRLGQGRRRVFEVSGTDPNLWQLSNAYVELTGDNVAGAKR